MSCVMVETKRPAVIRRPSKTELRIALRERLEKQQRQKDREERGKKSRLKRLYRRTRIKWLTKYDIRDATDRFQIAYIKAQLKRFGGNVQNTAAAIRMERSALQRKMKLLGVRR